MTDGPITKREAKRRRPPLSLGQWSRHGLDTCLLVAGLFVMALSFNRFLVPHHIACGGVVGISSVLHLAFNTNSALVQLITNVLILIAGGIMLGRGAVWRGIIGSLLLPVAVSVTTGPTWADDQLLAAVAGGAGLGAGLGLALRSGSTIGGFSLLARIIDRHTGWGVARTLALMDGVVILAVGAVTKSPQTVILSMAAIFATTRAVDMVNTGLARAKTIWIVSKHSAAIREAVLHQLDLGMTVIAGRGGFSDEPCDVLMVVVAPGDLFRVKQVVVKIDRDAFTTVADAHEVLGHGFHHY